MPVPVAAGSKARVCGRSMAGIVGSKSTGGMDICLLWELSFEVYKSLWWADHSPRGVLPNVMCPANFITKPQKGRP
jgi:hypothetical protein